MENLILYSTLVGAALLVLLCISDFRQRVKRPTSRLLYSLALLLFLIFNLSVYLLLVVVFIGQQELVGGDTPQGELGPVAIPVIVAVLYFGAGAATIRLFGTEFSLYHRLIEAFVQLFHFVIDSADVRDAIRQSEDEYDKYRQWLAALHDEAKVREWDELAEDWKEIQEETAFVEAHIEDLDAMRTSLETDQSAESLEKVVEKANKRTLDLHTRLIQRLKNHLYGFILKNAKTQEDVRHMLEGLPDAIKKIDLKIGSPPGGGARETWNVMQSALVGGFFGFFVGLVAMALPDERVLATPWIAAASCSLFMAIFHFAMESRDPVRAGLFGGLAGGAGNMLWALLAQLAVSAAGIDWMAMGQAALRSTQGVIYGVASGLLLFLFRDLVCKRTERCMMRLVIVAGIGAVAFSLIAAGIPQLYKEPLPMPGQLAGMAAIGAIFFVGIAHAMRLLRRQTS